MYNLYYESGKYVQSLENFKECAQHDSIQYEENRNELDWMHGDSIEYTETINISKVNNSISQYLCMINIDHMEEDVKKLGININQLIDSFDNLDTLLNKISIRSRRFWWFEGQGYSLSSTHIIYYHFVLKLKFLQVVKYFYFFFL